MYWFTADPCVEYHILSSHFFNVLINSNIPSMHISSKSYLRFMFSGSTFMDLILMSCLLHC